MDSAVTPLGRTKAEGRKLIGCFPPYPPLPLFHSMGLVPVVLWGLGDEVRSLSEADRRIQNYACSVARRLAQFVIADGKNLLDGIYFYNACDTLRNMPEILQAGLGEQGLANMPMFRMHVPMTPASQADASDYLRNEAINLIANLEKQFGLVFSEEKFRQSAALYSRLRGLCLSLETGMSEGRISFSAFCETMTRANFFPVEDQITLLESKISSLPSGPAPKRPAGRVIVSGILPPSAAVCKLMDEAGLRVVGNDIASLFRSYAALPVEWTDAADYCVRFYQGHFPCSTLLNLSEKRMDAVATLAIESGADGFMFVGEKFCEYEYFDIPDLEKILKSRGLATLAIEISMDDDENVAAFKTRIEAFAEILSDRAERAGNIGGRK